MQLRFADACRLPMPGDNTAIAVRRLESGTDLLLPDGSRIVVGQPVLEGHRLAVAPIDSGAPLLSWGLPFGHALTTLTAGDYVCNEKMLAELRLRGLDIPLPAAPNFRDHYAPFVLDEHAFRPGEPQAPALEPRSFEGFARTDGRGVGTRNHIVIVGVTSRASGFVQALARRFADVPRRFPNIDGVAAVAHTEGGVDRRPNNLDFLLRTLAGFVVHPNVGAALMVDPGHAWVTGARLREFLAQHRYPLGGLLHSFLDVGDQFESALRDGEAVINGWLETVNACQRTRQPLAHLNFGLQCGGSDAFSGISANPLIGWMAGELVRHDGKANLAETDELVGAESYILENTRDLDTARAFLRQIERFEERVSWHGLTAQSNPSGGNLLRGLYNIAIKSLGAARKKPPEVRLDHVIDYAQPMREPGYYFMDSPGNDLESIAGQVAAGCNLILFTTGNGSITNFPFVPTIKVMTTTARFERLRSEMDFNAGRYLQGEALADLGREAFELAVQVASGQRSAGEHSGQSQVQFWREWRQTNRSRLPMLLGKARPNGAPLRLKEGGETLPDPWPGERATGRSPSAQQVGLVVPTSLCSGQVAGLVVERLRQSEACGRRRFVALPHTEGCGVSGEEAIEILQRTLVSYACHPAVRAALFLEHGCEKTHNDAMREFLRQHRLPAERFGWASIQLDGGIESVSRRVERWFEQNLAGTPEPAPEAAGGPAPRLGIAGLPREVPEVLTSALALVARTILRAGGTVVVSQNLVPAAGRGVVRQLTEDVDSSSTLAYGEMAVRSGLHVMETPTDDLLETLTGLGATGVDLILVAGEPGGGQGHVLLPVLHVAEAPAGAAPADLRGAGGEADLTFNRATATAGELAQRIRGLVARTHSGEYTPRARALGNEGFQVTRGWLGVST